MTGRIRVVAALLAAVTAARLVAITRLQALAWDEIEFFRAADWIRRGLLPYRDFWEHHLPLQWFVFAPLTAFVRTAGASAIVAMRWMQLPLWVVTFVCIAFWARRVGATVLATTVAVTLTIASSFFAVWAGQYRVDALSCALFAAALLALQSRKAAWAGVGLALAGLANLRFAPLLAVTVLGAMLLPRQKKTALAAGVAITLGAAVVWALATHTAAPALESVFRENLRGDRDQPLQVGFFGVMIESLARGFDVAGAAALVIGSIGVVRVIATRWRERDDQLFLALVTIAAVLFIAAPKAIFPYHFLIAFVLLIPFVSMEIDRWRANSWLVPALSLIVVISIASTLLRGQEADLAYQNAVMIEADRATPAGAKVFDGVGWALHRDPAYRYWFLPLMVRTLEAEHLIPSYRIAADPPAAIVTDLRAIGWIATHRDLLQFARRHYLPRYRNLWLPAMNAALAPGEGTDWVVPLTATYRIYASEPLATHPWFQQPLAVGGPEVALPLEVSLRGFPPASSQPMRFTVDGVVRPPSNVLALRRGQRVHVDTRFAQQVAIIIAPVDDAFFFRTPAPGVTLDAVEPPQLHLPRL